MTRNQFGSNPTWVRIPPAAPKKPFAFANGFFHAIHTFCNRKYSISTLFLQLLDLLQAPLHGGLTGLDLNIWMGALQIVAGSVLIEKVKSIETNQQPAVGQCIVIDGRFCDPTTHSSRLLAH